MDPLSTERVGSSLQLDPQTLSRPCAASSFWSLSPDTNSRHPQSPVSEFSESQVLSRTCFFFSAAELFFCVFSHSKKNRTSGVEPWGDGVIEVSSYGLRHLHGRPRAGRLRPRGSGHPLGTGGALSESPRAVRRKRLGARVFGEPIFCASLGDKMRPLRPIF